VNGLALQGSLWFTLCAPTICCTETQICCSLAVSTHLCGLPCFRHITVCAGPCQPYILTCTISSIPCPTLTQMPLPILPTSSFLTTVQLRSHNHRCGGAGRYPAIQNPVVTQCHDPMLNNVTSTSHPQPHSSPLHPLCILLHPSKHL
jgi:hypothetical protein